MVTTEQLTQAYYMGREAAGTGMRNPFKACVELAAEWAKGRDQKRRANRMDLRPAFRKHKRRPRVL